MDIVGSLPVFVSLTDGLDSRKRFRVALQAVVAGLLTGLLFLFLGNPLFRVLGITQADFRVAGGLLLLVFAVHDILFTRAERKRRDVESLGVVPIGIPLLVGPAVLTTLILSQEQHGTIPTLVAFVGNLLFALGAMGLSGPLLQVLGNGGAKGAGKVASILLAAIAVMMIRSGVQAMVQ